MPAEPAIKRTISFFDGQNLYHAAKAAFGYIYPNYVILRNWPRLSVRPRAGTVQRYVSIRAFPMLKMLSMFGRLTFNFFPLKLSTPPSKVLEP